MRCWLKKAREEKGVTMADMAKALDISEGYYSLIESGKRQEKMDIELLVRISSALGIQLMDAASRECALFPSPHRPPAARRAGQRLLGAPLHERGEDERKGGEGMKGLKVKVWISTWISLEEALKEIQRLRTEYPDVRFDVRVSK